MANPTNEDLETQIREVDERSEKRHQSMLTTFSRFKNEVREQLAPFHDYLVGQDAIKNLPKTNGLSIPQDVVKIILWLVAIIAALVGVTQLPK